MKKFFFFGLLALAGIGFLDAQTGILRPPPHQPAPPSGFYGQSLFFHSAGPGSPFQPPPEGLPYKTYINVYDASGLLVKRAVSNPVGQFYSYLKPGDYSLLATPPGQHPPPHTLSEYSPPGSASGLPAAPLVNITVGAEKLTRADVVYSQVE